MGYTGDTGPEPALGSFFRGVDVLVSECAYADPPPSASHLSPSSVAAMARSAQPEVLVLTHLYPPLDSVSAPRLVREAGYSGKVVCARDGEGFVLGQVRHSAGTVPHHDVKTTLHYVNYSIHSATPRLRSALLLGRIALPFTSRRALPARRLTALGARTALSTDCRVCLRGPLRQPCLGSIHRPLQHTGEAEPC